MLPQVLPKASTTSDTFGDGVCRISITMAGVCRTRKIRYTAVHGYPHEPKESRTDLFSLVILYKNKYGRKKTGFKVTCLVYNMKSVKNKIIN
jgi:hypothetical protein